MGKIISAAATCGVLFAALALGGTACSSDGGGDRSEATSDYPSYSSAGELLGAADLVVEAALEGTRTEDIDVSEEGGQEPVEYTVHTFTVSEVHKGELSDRRVEVKRAVDTSGPELVEGSAYVLFLETYGDDVPPSLVNPDQGAHLVGDDGELEPVGGSLEVDRDDLS
ncbi:hypothetical protein [Nocardiopsis valliformis]|uniref:hypothetical protein n=1 Tax=Nocardiopsis valliformis TaxID=239974 RepID=UPI00034744B4|nr:hypothetical protein [Nocardiopsis valliformis]